MSPPTSTRGADEMDHRDGGNVPRMHHAHAPIAVALLVLGGCVATESSLEDGGQPMVDGTIESGAGTTTVDDPGMTSAGGPGPTTAEATSVDGATSEAGDESECQSAELDGCYAAADKMCRGEVGWVLNEACIAAVVACFHLGTDLLAPADVIGLCHAEIEEDCYFGAEPGCGLPFCECTVGTFPYDWTNCWHLTAMACDFGQASDCEAVVQSCYPGTTVAEFETCYTQVREADLGYVCQWATIGVLEQCEADLAACLGA